MSEALIIPIPKARLNRYLLCVMWLLAAGICPCTLSGDVPAAPDRSAPELAGSIAQTISECEATDGFIASALDAEGNAGRISLQSTRAARIEGNSVQVTIQAAPAGNAELRLPWRAQMLPTFVALWIKNPDGHDIALGVSLVHGADVTVLPHQRLGEERNWRQVAFALPPDEAGGITALAITFSELIPTQSYEFYIDRIEAYRPPPMAVRSEVRCPSEAISAGRAFDTRLTLTPTDTRPAWPRMELVLRRNGFVVGAGAVSPPGSPTAGKSVDCGPITLSVPPVCLPGEYEVALSGGGTTTADSTAGTVRIVAGPAAPRPAELLARTGVIGEVNGAGAAASLKLQMIDVACAYDLYGRCADTWLAAEEFDYSGVDARLSELVQTRPDASVLLRVFIDSPPWWDEAHPAELVRFADGKTQATAGVPGRKRTYASWASQTWRADAEKSLRALIEHVEGLPIAPAVAGYLLCSGEWGNWQYPGASRGLFADYSAPQKIAYREWLRKRYGGLSALRVAWNQPGNPEPSAEGIADGKPILAWTQIGIPTPAERMKANLGCIRDPAGEQHLVDYDAFASDAMADAIAAMAAVVASAAPEKLCGAAYGHVFDQARYPYALQNGGHLGAPTLAECDDVDFFAAPAAGLPGQSGDLATFGVCDASLRARGKGIIYTWPWHLQPSDDVQRARNSAVQAVCSGAAVTIPAELVDDELRAIDAARADAGRPQLADVAVILDHYSIAHTICGDALTGPLLDEQRRAVTLMGMPADVWFLEDVLAGNIPVYRFYLVPDAFFLQANDRAALRAQLARDGATGLYVYLAGAIDLTIGGRTMKDLMGITPVRLRDSGLLQVSLGDGAAYGTREPVSPRFVFGRDGDPVAGLVGSGHGGLVERRGETGLVVWSAAPNVPAALLSEYAVDAGAHLYCDQKAAVYGAGPLMGVRATTSGRHRLLLPEAADVYDCLTGRQLGTNTTGVDLELEQGDTVLLRIGSRPGERP